MQLNTGDTVVINSTHQCNILMTTDSEFNNYRNGRTSATLRHSISVIPAH
ncbi:DUF1883 domain-containing protein [Arsenophonus nasoniae]|nr:DUF1883 domain-containing protein [Arsenophonus nasoniae]WGM04575.1 DUF1883 domain-containing protein [Arsenophonus nasoniae]WGM04952.1 DUF1883 domain-containing protein [Arsenophonus nasoniae]WGM09687.1 DUF1883 domain-containing protein [Arsenophonus nasoniae]WGM10053.1 DUF1883 domain-containing protein [Arsenophonus nasoniae]WGM14405.1 DUF1883 domain-containing protein [Arsenophonus nasoniae]